jgi:hypothetical protein
MFKKNKKKIEGLFSAREQAFIMKAIKDRNATSVAEGWPTLDTQKVAAVSVMLACAYQHKGQLHLTPSASPFLGKFHK